MTHQKKIWTHQISTRKKIGPTKYLRRHVDHETHNSTRPTIARDPRNLADSSYMIPLFLSVFLSSSFSSTISTSLSLFLSLLLSLSPPRPISLILSLPLCLFKMSFHGDRSTSFPRKSPFQLEALYLNIHKLDFSNKIPLKMSLFRVENGV